VSAGARTPRRRRGSRAGRRAVGPALAGASWLAAATVGAGALGCGGGGPGAGTPGAGPRDGAGPDAGAIEAGAVEAGAVDASVDEDLGPLPALMRVVVTADWGERRLTVLHAGVLAEPAGPAERAILRRIDVGAHAPGPLELALTPDGRTAAVAVGPGFFDTAAGGIVGVTGVAEGGALLVVDIVEGAVRHVVATPSPPMGVAVTPDGARALTADYGPDGARGRTVSVIDLERGALVDSVEVCPWPEQIALDEAGTLALVSCDGDGTVVAFDPRDIRGTRSTPLVVDHDPGHIAFVPGTTLAVVARSLGETGLAVVDVADPARPRLAGALRLPGIPFGVAHVPGSTDVLLPLGLLRPAQIARVSLASGAPVLARTYEVPVTRTALPLHACVSADGARAFVPLPGPGLLGVIDLETGAARTIDWLEARAAPTWCGEGPAVLP
jgi:hypothetical protein